MSEWIKCNDEMPKKTCKCWVYFDDGDLYVMTHIKNKGFCKDENINYAAGEVKPLFWFEIPVPDLPKD